MSHHMTRKCLVSAFAIAITLPTYALAEANVTETKTTVTGPATVVESYMKPTIVRSTETTDADGNTKTTVAPLIQERHEKVVIPSEETTTTEVQSSASEVKTKEVLSHAASQTHVAKKTKVVAHQPRHKRTYTAAKRSTANVATRETKVITPATYERTQSVTEKETVVERRDPALDAQ
jgi:hypothetical protein